MEKLFAGPFGLLLVIAQASFFIYLMRGLVHTASEDDSVLRASKFQGSPKAKDRPVAGRMNPQSFWSPKPKAEKQRMLEPFYDAKSGVMTARVLSGLYANRLLEDLARTDLMRLHETCRYVDAEAASLIEAYMFRRFGQAEAFAEPPPSAREDRMSRERALDILGLKAAANEDDVNRAYRALIKKHHPDHGGSHAKAAEINYAKDFLLG